MTLAHRALRRALSTSLLTLALVAGATAQEKDTVTLKNGNSETGKIKSEEYGALVFDKTDKTIAWSDIAPMGVTYGNAPQFGSALDAFNNGKLDDALKAFEELKGEKNLRPVLKQHALYYVPLILQRQGKFDEALAGYKDLLTAFPKSRRLFEVGENYLAIYMAKKDPVAGAKALDQLSTDALGAGVPTGFDSAISVLKGRLIEEQKKFAEAQALYTLAEKAPGVAPSVVAQAILGQGRCAVGLGDKTKAEGIFRKVVTGDGDGSILAGGWNGLGDLMLEDGKGGGATKKADADKILDALFCYLRGVVQYTPQPGESSAEYEHALFGASECFKYLGQLDPKAESKQANMKRSSDRLDQLRREFPNSPYLK